MYVHVHTSVYVSVCVYLYVRVYVYMRARAYLHVDSIQFYFQECLNLDLGI